MNKEILENVLVELKEAREETITIEIELMVQLAEIKGDVKVLNKLILRQQDKIKSIILDEMDDEEIVDNDEVVISNELIVEEPTA